jgi:hypothetical protein
MDIKRNREFFLEELRSGKYEKGTTVSDEKGNPVTDGEDNGYCACALMHDLFYNMDGVESDRNYLKALQLTTAQCRYIQKDLNDTLLSFPEIADRIEQEVFV